MICSERKFIRGGDSSVPVDYRTDDPEGEGSMSAVLETSDRHVDRVSVIADLFWKSSYSKHFYPDNFTGTGNYRPDSLEGGMFQVRYVRGVRWVYG